MDFEYLESKVFYVEVVGAMKPVEFKLCELPNDMKMLCFLGGELSNSAKYFTTFADVSSDDKMDYKKKYGVDWKPYSYGRRCTDGKKAEKMWVGMESSTNTYSTKRNKLTKYISTTLKSKTGESTTNGKIYNRSQSRPIVFEK